MHMAKNRTGELKIKVAIPNYRRRSVSGTASASRMDNALFAAGMSRIVKHRLKSTMLTMLGLHR